MSVSIICVHKFYAIKVPPFAHFTIDACCAVPWRQWLDYDLREMGGVGRSSGKREHKEMVAIEINEERMVLKMGDIRDYKNYKEDIQDSIV